MHRHRSPKRRLLLQRRQKGQPFQSNIDLRCSPRRAVQPTPPAFRSTTAACHRGNGIEMVARLRRRMPLRASRRDLRRRTVQRLDGGSAIRQPRGPYTSPRSRVSIPPRREAAGSLARSALVPQRSRARSLHCWLRVRCASSTSRIAWRIRLRPGAGAREAEERNTSADRRRARRTARTRDRRSFNVATNTNVVVQRRDSHPSVVAMGSSHVAVPRRELAFQSIVVRQEIRRTRSADVVATNLWCETEIEGENPYMLAQRARCVRFHVSRLISSAAACARSRSGYTPTLAFP